MGAGLSRTAKSGGILRVQGSCGHGKAEDMFAKSQAAVLVGAASAWPCGEWDQQWFCSNFGHHTVQVSHKDACGNVVRKERLELRDFMSQIGDLDMRSESRRAGVVPYVDNFDIFELAPEFRSSVPSESLFGPTRGLVIYGGFLGPAGSVTRIHVDSEDNIITCVFGRKLFVLVPPMPSDSLDFGARDIPLEDPWATDVTEIARRHPMFANCRDYVQTVILGPGDVLLQPRGWSHWVHNLELSLSVPCWAKVLPSV